MKNPLRKDPIAVAEAQIRKFEAAIEKIDLKTKLAQEQLEKHRAARRTHLLENPEEEIPAEIRHGLDIAQRHVEALGEDRAEMVVALDELREALTFERQRGERDAAAKILEGAASSLDEAGAELHAAMAGVAKSIERLVSAIPEDIATYWADHTTRPPGRNGGQFASSSEVASAVLAESLYSVVPRLFDETTEMIQTGFGWAPTHLRRIALHRIDLSDVPRAVFNTVRPGATALEAAKAISDQWRDRANRIRAGELIPDASMIAAELPKPRDPGLDEVEIFTKKEIAYVQNTAGGRRLCGRAWVHRVPALVADAAVDAGLALRTDTPEGRDAFEARKEYRNKSMTTVETSVRLEDCVDLGDVLGLTTRNIAAE